jgi:hypothetical protein
VTAARRGDGMLAVAVARGGGIGIGMRLCFGFVIGR